MKSLILKPDEVQGILSGRQTQLRRPIKWEVHSKSDGCKRRVFLPKDIDAMNALLKERQRSPLCQFSPFGQPGDRIACKETWAHHGSCACYRADGWTGLPDVGYKVHPPLTWKSPATMPQWASRITLEVLSVRVERLQDISEEDAKSGGIDNLEIDPADGILRKMTNGHRNNFVKQWQSDHGKDSWDRNDWTWILHFKRVKP
jgi:hypothetical protein